jgi:hypothetical protein
MRGFCVLFLAVGLCGCVSFYEVGTSVPAIRADAMEEAEPEARYDGAMIIEEEEERSDFDRALDVLNGVIELLPD